MRKSKITGVRSIGSGVQDKGTSARTWRLRDGRRASRGFIAFAVGWFVLLLVLLVRASGGATREGASADSPGNGVPSVNWDVTEHSVFGGPEQASLARKALPEWLIANSMWPPKDEIAKHEATASEQQCGEFGATMASLILPNLWPEGGDRRAITLRKWAYHEFWQRPDCDREDAFLIRYKIGERLIQVVDLRHMTFVYVRQTGDGSDLGTGKPPTTSPLDVAGGILTSGCLPTSKDCTKKPLTGGFVYMSWRCSKDSPYTHVQSYGDGVATVFVATKLWTEKRAPFYYEARFPLTGNQDQSSLPR